MNQSPLPTYSPHYSLPTNIAIQIAMLIIILRPIPINITNITVGSITIISDQLQSLKEVKNRIVKRIRIT
jgi:hypothetical protein